ncbi:ATP-grasp domain-containing protein [Rummeliibacillus sp. TYF005]|uniref:ATP-grasp domain-containing protein n=1 Tax=Rummeliibacillus sp. TYF005 TaxID=2058214 RepID=UPI000FC0377A|nr:ATP-grasp domain-containing protein [Rummeliibacillus sp. TYF005]RPJ96122.1 ATP-grasp domain-containing protein [Rummeliibacillus sp. TYF005]
MVTEKIHQMEKLDAIFTFKEAALYNVSKIQSLFNFKGNSISSVKSCLDKYITRKILKDHGFLSPKFNLCKTIDEVKEFWKCNKHPIILKPRNQQGSIGVRKVEEEHEIETAFNQTIIYKDEEDFILVEEFIEGEEVSLEAIIYKGNVYLWGVTKKLLYSQTFVESGHISPYARKKENELMYRQVLQDVVRALDIQFGPLHLEGFHSADGFIVGEVHTRYGGDNIVNITEIANNCDMHTPIFAELADLEYDIPSVHESSVCAIKFLDAKPGFVKTLEGLDTLKKHPNVVDYNINLEVGDQIGSIESSYDRSGWVMVKAKNYQEIDKVIKSVEKIMKLITI